MGVFGHPPTVDNRARFVDKSSELWIANAVEVKCDSVVGSDAARTGWLSTRAIPVAGWSVRAVVCLIGPAPRTHRIGSVEEG